MGPKRSLEKDFFSLKSQFLRGVQRHILGLQCHQSGCNSGWRGLDVSVGPVGCILCLYLVMGAMIGAQWVQNDHLRGSFLA